MVASPSARCRTHSSTRAGWFCEGCNSSLCPRCVAEESFSITRVETCCRCGERAVPLRLHRSHRSYASRLVDSWRFLTKGSTWVSIVALGVFSAAVLWIGGGLGALVVTGAMWAYLFYAFICAARGAELDVPDFSSVSDITTPLLRGVIGSLYIWVPALLYVVYSRGVGDEAFTTLFSDPIFYLILGWGLFYGPIAFMVAATNTSFLTLLNPVAMVNWAIKLGTDYLLALVAMGVCLGVDILLGSLGNMLAETGVPLISGAVPQVLSLVMPFLMAHMLGLLLYVRGDKVGYGMDEDYYERVLPDAKPEGQVPTRNRGKVSAQASPGPVAPVAEPVAEAPEAASGAVTAAAAGLKRVAEAITARDVAGALDGYRGLVSSQLSSLPADQHLFVARAAASGGDFPLAAKAFETAADVAPNAATAPQALVLLARLCGERMQDPTRAASVYRYIVHRYPNTDAARFAAQRLPPSA